MTDCIVFEEVIIPVHVGAVEEERRVAQPICFDLKIYCNLKPSGLSDALDDTLNYEEIYQTLLSVSSSRPFVLLESLCEEICAALLKGIVQSVRVRAGKVRPPILGMQGRISVEMERSR